MEIHLRDRFFSVEIRFCFSFFTAHLDPVVQRPISANPGLDFNPGFHISLFKSHFGIILAIVLRAFNYQIVVKKK